MSEEKQILVWTNGNAIRKYTGQDKLHPLDNKRHTKEKGWYKARAILKPIEEE